MSGIQGLITAQFMMIIYLMVGCFCRWLGYVDDHVENKLTSAVMNIVLPCMIFDAILGTLGDVVLSEVVIVVVICTALPLTSYGIGWLLYYKTPRENRSVLIYSLLSSNAAFVGLPIISAVYGDHGVFFAAIYMTIVRLLVWTIGLNLFIQGSRKQILRQIATNPNNIAVVLAVLVYYIGIEIPPVISNVVAEIGSTSTLLCMVMVGSLIIGNLSWKKLLSIEAYIYSAIRLIGIPLLTLVILRFFHVQPVIIGSLVVLVAAPAPTLGCVMAARYRANKELAALLVLVSTVISFITQPLMALLCG